MAAVMSAVTLTNVPASARKVGEALIFSLVKLGDQFFFFAAFFFLHGCFLLHCFFFLAWFFFFFFATLFFFFDLHCFFPALIVGYSELYLDNTQFLAIQFIQWGYP